LSITAAAPDNTILPSHKSAASALARPTNSVSVPQLSRQQMLPGCEFINIGAVVNRFPLVLAEQESKDLPPRPMNALGSKHLPTGPASF